MARPYQCISFPSLLEEVAKKTWQQEREVQVSEVGAVGAMGAVGAGQRVRSEVVQRGGQRTMASATHNVAVIYCCLRRRVFGVTHRASGNSRLSECEINVYFGVVVP
jgi:hypothetical protein